ncbi:2Fe-2S iron-sulfur cluster-binding protein [Streptomyces chartreusis]|uniref:2Fe-2S iron-sulfur cluster-binding protein n=1 Tax=Streptomyces chartreusis TaxID=1969 RepID=UPI003D925253
MCLRVVLEGHLVVNGGTLLDSAESAGLKLPSVCRSGACGPCRKPVTGTVALLTEPVIQLEADQSLLCCAVPAARHRDPWMSPQSESDVHHVISLRRVLSRVVRTVRGWDD